MAPLPAVAGAAASRFGGFGLFAGAGATQPSRFSHPEGLSEEEYLISQGVLDPEEEQQAAFEEEGVTPEQQAVLEYQRAVLAAGGDPYAVPGVDVGDEELPGVPIVGFSTEGLGDKEVLRAFIAAAIESEGGLSAEFIPDITRAVETLGEMEELEKGNLKLEDGRMISLADFEGADPLVQAQLAQELTNRQIDIENANTELFNRYNLQKYSAGQAAASAENSRRMQSFNNANTEFRNKLAAGEFDINRAVKAIGRQLDGLSESRQRADFEATQTRLAAPLATANGKTSFSGQDLGAGVTALMQQAGIPNAAEAQAISFPGTIDFNPAQMLARGDQQLGVTGPLPEVPNISAPAVPGAPGLVGGGGPAPTPLPLQPGQTIDPAAIAAAALAQLQAGATKNRVQASPSPPLSTLPLSDGTGVR